MTHKVTQAEPQIRDSSWQNQIASRLFLETKASRLVSSQKTQKPFIFLGGFIYISYQTLKSNSWVVVDKKNFNKSYYPGSSDVTYP